MRRFSLRILGACAQITLLAAPSTAVEARAAASKPQFDPNLRRHWDSAFDVALPNGVSSDDLKGRCWTQTALDSYITEGWLWIEDVYGLPYGYVDSHCLREQLTKSTSR